MVPRRAWQLRYISVHHALPSTDVSWTNSIHRKVCALSRAIICLLDRNQKCGPPHHQMAHCGRLLAELSRPKGTSSSFSHRLLAQRSIAKFPMQNITVTLKQKKKKKNCILMYIATSTGRWTYTLQSEGHCYNNRHVLGEYTANYWCYTCTSEQRD